MYLHTLSKLYNIEKSSNSVPSIASIYNRLRYLYKHYKNRLTTWEVDFLVSVGNQLKQNIELTDRQQVKVKQLLKKFKVSPLDTASVEISKSSMNGTYACVNLSLISSKRLHRYLSSYFDKHQITPIDKFHITTTFSKRVIHGLVPTPVSVTLRHEDFEYEVFDGDSRVLVLRVKHPKLNQLFNKAKQLGATWDFPTYKPHITLINDFKDREANLPLLPHFDLFADEYVVEPLDLS